MKSSNYYFFVFLVLIFASCLEKPECKSMLQKNCLYTKEYNPVCGCDGITYGNSGEAGCHGIDDYTQGSCGSVNEDTFKVCGESIVVDIEKFKNVKQEYLEIDSVSLDETCLTVYVKHSGCDDKVNYQLVASGFIMESYPVQQNIKLGLERKQLCEAVIRTEQVFDLKDALGANDKMYFHLEGYKNAIYYEAKP